MSESFTLTLSGTSSVLQAHYFPPIELLPSKSYSLGFIGLLTFNSIPNIDTGKNKFYVGDEVIIIPTGTYEIEDIANYLNEVLNQKEIYIELIPNEKTLCSELKCNKDVNFIPDDSIGTLLGFSPRVLVSKKLHSSDLPVAILHINSIRLECNITSGAYINERCEPTIHEFFPIVPRGYKVVEKPSNIIYLPITVQAIDHLQLMLVDQNGKLVNFRGEIITVRLHVKS